MTVPPPRPAHLLLIHTATAPTFLAPLKRTLRQTGITLRITLIKKAPTADDRALCDTVYDHDAQRDPAATLAWLQDLHRRDPFHGVTSFSESGVCLASIAAQVLGLPGSPPLAVLRARNKWLMRQALRTAGVPSADCWLVRDPAEVAAHLERRPAGRPLILKPLSGSSSYGVTKLPATISPAELAQRWDAMVEYVTQYPARNPSYPFEFWLPPALPGIPPSAVMDPRATFLLEEYLEGRQVSVDGVVVDGAVTTFGVIEVQRADGTYFLESEEWMPTGLEPQAEAAISRRAAEAVRAVGLTRACFHCELKWDGREARMIELAARRGADNIGDFLQRVLGVDIHEEGVRLALGHTRCYPRMAPRCAMRMRYFLPTTRGRLDAIEGVDAIRQDPHLAELVLDCHVGDRILVPPDSFEFLGYLSAWGRTPADAEAAVNRLCAQLRFIIHQQPQEAAAYAPLPA